MTNIRKATIRSLAVLVLSSAGIAVGISTVQAATETGSASMTITEPLTITETTPLSFGTLNAPSSGSATIDLSTAGELVVSGGSDAFHTGSHAVGSWTLNGSPNAQASTTVAIGTWNDAAITTNASYINGATDTATVTLDATGAGSMTIGGNITVTNAVTVGAKTATVTVTANYF